MKMKLSDIAIRGLLYHRRSYIFLALVVALISGVITASLLSGYSVKQTLIETSNGRLNGGGIMISSGLRNMDAGMAKDISGEINSTAAPVMMLTGVTKNFASGRSIHNSQIIGIDTSFLLNGWFTYIGPPWQG